MGILRFRQCNCCRLNEVCQANRVTLRAAKQIPGCIPAERDETFCEKNNVDVKVTDVAEKIVEITQKYLSSQLGYEDWRRQYINYGLIRPKA